MWSILYNSTIVSGFWFERAFTTVSDHSLFGTENVEIENADIDN